MLTHRVLVADELAAEGLAILEAVGEVVVRPGMDEDALCEALSTGFHALVVRSATTVTARALQAATKLVVVGRAGIGVDNVDVPAATERGIVVMNTPDANAVSTAEHTLSLMFSMARHVAAADASIRRGEWTKGKFIGTELTGKTLGILGLGRIGRTVADRAVGLSMQVIAHDPFVTEANAPAGVRLGSMEDVLAKADILTVHVPLLDATRGLLNRERLQSMKRGARLLVVARGGMVDEEALCELLESGHLAGAALDVFAEEPLPEDHPLRKVPGTVFTPHLGASTAEAKRGVSVEVAKQIVTCLSTGVALNGINVPRIAPGEASMVGPYMALTQHLAAFLTGIVSGKVESLRLTVQGALPERSREPLALAMLTGALRHRVHGTVTLVNAAKHGETMGIRVHAETSSMKRDFMNLVRVEAVIDGVRHGASGTVLGNKHGRMVEFDGFLFDAIPEPPLLVTFHRDSPGVVGHLGTILGQAHVNISRMQLGTKDDETASDTEAMAVWNLDSGLSDKVLARIRAEPTVHSAQVLR